MNQKGPINSNFLTWTGLRESVPIRTRPPSFKMVLDLENYKCRNYYKTLKQVTYERPKKWVTLANEFNLTDEQLSEAYLLPLRVASEPYVRSFQYKVLNSLLYNNKLLCKIGYITDLNCTFCKETPETVYHILFECSFSKSFWNDVIYNILSKLSSCRCLLLRDVSIGFLRKEMDLINYVLLIGKIHIWDCRRKGNKPVIAHFKQILKNKYDTE